MTVIWKYRLSPHGPTVLAAPRGANFIAVEARSGRATGEDLVAWAEVDPSRPLVQLKFLAIWTGEEFNNENLLRLGTVTLPSGLVVHVYEDLPETDP